MPPPGCAEGISSETPTTEWKRLRCALLYYPLLKSRVKVTCHKSERILCGRLWKTSNENFADDVGLLGAECLTMVAIPCDIGGLR